MNSRSPDLVSDLLAHLKVCEELLAVVERENQSLRDADAYDPFEYYQARRHLLPRLADSLEILRRHRAAWQMLPVEERQRQPEQAALFRQNQDLIMRILVLDRENEQALLRRGLVPAQHVPPVQRHRPDVVADLYRRGSA